jgi:hypothetical protein
VVLGAVHLQETQLALDQVSFTLWQDPSSKHPVSEHVTARERLDGVVAGRVVMEVNIKHCGTSPQLTCP